MPAFLLLLPILLPIVGGGYLYFMGEQHMRKRRRYIAIVVLINSILTWLMILFCNQDSFHILNLVWDLDLVLRFDKLGRFFSGLIATLWPLTTFYAFGYLDHAEHKNLFYSFFIMTYGVTLGVAMAGNLLTLYCFYELLTLVTVPLVMHSMTKEAVRAARIYLGFSIGGAAIAFLGIVYLSTAGVDMNFLPGGVASSGADANKLLAAYVCMFLGLGVKAAVFPLHKWLPTAAVAPTPVTALLHAVAVVKSGVFAIMRLTFFCFDPTFLRGTWAQAVVMCLALVSILFGSWTSLRCTDWKQRLAYSTVSNLSYILFGITLMTEAGLIAAMLHMLCHAVIKILAFFCAGSVLCMTERRQVMELEGLGRKMPLTFVTFLVSALALTGIPPFCGFFGKWALLTSALATEGPIAAAGAVVLLISAFLTAMYMLPTAVRAFLPRKAVTLPDCSEVHEAPVSMWIPMLILAVLVIGLGLFAGPVKALLAQIAAGII